MQNTLALIGGLKAFLTKNSGGSKDRDIGIKLLTQTDLGDSLRKGISTVADLCDISLVDTMPANELKQIVRWLKDRSEAKYWQGLSVLDDPDKIVLLEMDGLKLQLLMAGEIVLGDIDKQL